MQCIGQFTYEKQDSASTTEINLWKEIDSSNEKMLEARIPVWKLEIHRTQHKEGIDIEPVLK